MENHSVTVQDALRYAVDYMEGRIKDEAFSTVYPDWFFPKIVCANVNCKYNGFRNMCDRPQVRLNYRHLHTTNEGLVDVYECKDYEIREDVKQVNSLEELMEYVHKHSVYGAACKEET